MTNLKEKDYRKILREAVLAKKDQPTRGFSFQGLANACRVQKSYISKVLNGGGHLSEDQVYACCDYLEFGEKLKELVMLLAAFARSTMAKRRADLQRQIDSLRDLLNKSEAHLDAVPVVAATERPDLQRYFCDPFVQVVHLFLTIPVFANTPDRLIEHLSTNRQRVVAALRCLEDIGFIAYDVERKTYKVLREGMHLKSESPYFGTYRAMHRLHALGKIEQCSAEETYNFTALFSADKSARDFVLEDFYRLIKNSEKRVKDSKLENVYQINFDIFRW